MCADVDAERELPDLLGGLEVGADGDSGVGAEQVHRPKGLRGARDEVDHLRLVGDVAAHAERALADLGRHGLRPLRVEVGDDHPARALLGQTPGERPPDARRCAGDHRDPVCQLHGHHHRLRRGRRALPLTLRRARSSAVEHRPYKAGVAGSSPAARIVGGERIHARDRRRRPDRFEPGRAHRRAVKASMPVTGDLTGSSPSRAHLGCRDGRRRGGRHRTRRTGGGRDQHGGRQRDPHHLPGAAGLRLLASDGQRLQHDRPGARFGVRRGRLPARARGPATTDTAPGHRLAPGRHHRRGAAARPARLGVQGDRAGLHRHRTGARRPAAAPEPDAGRAPDQPRERGRAVDAARGLRRRRLRRLLRGGSGDPAARHARGGAATGPAAHQRAEERPHRDRQRRRRRSTSSSRPTSSGGRPRSSPAPRSSAASSARTTGAGYILPCCAA